MTFRKAGWATLFAGLLSCSSYDELGEGVANIYTFQFNDFVLVHKTNGELYDLRSDADAVRVPNLLVSEVRLPFAFTLDGQLIEILPGPGGRYGDASSIAIASTGASRLLGNDVMARQDGSIFKMSGYTPKFVVRELPEIRGATACVSSLCIVNGRFVDMLGLDVGVSGNVIGIEYLPWAEQEGARFGPGVAVLRGDGTVATAAYNGYQAVYVTDLPRLPPIRRLHRGFFEDAQGHIWYQGVVVDGWPSALMSDDTPRHPCKADNGFPKQFGRMTTCVDPIEIPALAGTRPYLLLDKDDNPLVYAILPNGTLRCWASENGPVCPKGE